jgi:hypothetical protein
VFCFLYFFPILEFVLRAFHLLCRCFTT